MLRICSNVTVLDLCSCISEPISLTICLGLSSDLILIPVISRQSLLRYCCVSSNEHSIRYRVSSCLLLVPTNSTCFCSSEAVTSLYFLSSLIAWLLDFCMVSMTLSYFFEFLKSVASLSQSVDAWFQCKYFCRKNYFFHKFRKSCVLSLFSVGIIPANPIMLCL